MTRVNNEEELARAVNEEREEIEIEISFLREFTLKVKSKGKNVWLLAMACVVIMLVIAYKLQDSGGVTEALKLPVAKRAIRLLGADTCASVLKMAIAGGGIIYIKYQIKNQKQKNK